MGAVGGSEAVGGRVEVRGLVVRGGAFHNKIVEEVRAVFLSYGWEVETSVRHVVDNVRKAEMVGVRLWVVVPSRKLCRLANRKLDEGLVGDRGEVLVVLVGEVVRKLGSESVNQH